MRKIVLLIALLFGASCQKQEVVTPELGSFVHSAERVDASAVVGTLSVGMSSNRNLGVGGTFVFTVSVKNGSQGVANVSVNVDNPINQMCSVVKTDSYGNGKYQVTVTSATKPQFYGFRFYYGTQSYYQIVGVGTAGFFTLPTFKVDMISAAYLSEKTNGASCKVYPESYIKNWNTARAIGKDAVSSYFKNPANAALVQFTFISCSLTPVIPPAGAACAAGVRAVALGISKDILKTWVKSLIDKSPNLTTAQKNAFKLNVDSANTAFDVFTMNPAGGIISQFDNLATIIDVEALVVDNIDNNTFCITYKKKNSDNVYNIGVCKR